MKTNVLIRALKQGDEERVNELFNLVFKEKRPIEEFMWKFKRTFSYSHEIIGVAQEKDSVIGVYPSMMVKLKIGKELRAAVLVVDTVTHPSSRRPKLILSLKKFAAERYKKIGCVFAFGFPNKTAHKVGKKILKYSDMFVLPVLVRRLNLRLAFRKRFGSRLEKPIYFFSNWAYKIYFTIKRPSFGSMRVCDIDSFDCKFDQLWENISSQYEIISVRDSNYLNWRYIQNPRWKYKILAAYDHENNLKGYMVIRLENKKTEKVGLIIDFLTLPDQNIIDILLYSAVSYFLSRKADYVQCAVLEEFPLYQSLTTFGSRLCSEKIKIVYEIYDREVSSEYLTNPKNWFLTYGDTDCH